MAYPAPAPAPASTPASAPASMTSSMPAMAAGGDTLHPSFSSSVMAHGGMMFLVFGVLLPISAMTARHLRRFPKTGPIRYWWGIHACLNALAVGLFLVAWTIAIYMAGEDQFNNPHKKLGLSILVVFLTQAFYGVALSILHNLKPTLRRNSPFEWIHWFLGYTLLILGWVNIPLGMYQASRAFMASRTVRILYFVWLGCLVVIMAALEVLYQTRGGNQQWKRPLADLNGSTPTTTMNGEKQPLGNNHEARTTTTAAEQQHQRVD